MICFFLLLSLTIGVLVLLVLNNQNKNEQPEEVEFYKEGQIFPVKTNASFILASTTNKISDNEIANGTQGKREPEFKNLAETVPTGNFTTDAFGAVNYVNPQWCEIAKISFSEAMGEGWLNAVHPQDRDNLVLAWRQAISANSSLKTEFRILHPDGSVVWVSAQAAAANNEEGNFNGYAGTLTEITEHKKMEEELFARKAKAEESDRLKTAFLNNLNHEIRTPLNAILGFSSLLKDTDLTAEDKDEFLSIIEESSIQLLNIINDIINISIIESDQIKVSKSEINLEEQIHYIHSLFDEEVKQKGLTLSVSNSPNSSKSLVTDHEKFNTILTNLVSNAVKFTEKGSIEFGYKTNNNHGDFEFFVKDTGIGISKEWQEAIFERFIQYDIIDKRVQYGLGLGLAISKAYVEILGGKMWVNSEEGKGSTFYFTLPNHSDQNEG